MKRAQSAAVPIGASLVVLSSLFYASYGAWTVLLGDSLDGYSVTVLRGLMLFPILLLIAYFRKSLSRINWRRDWKWCAIITISSLFQWGPLYYATLQIGVSLAIGIGYMALVLGAFLFGLLFANERFTREKVVATLFGITGIAMVFGFSFEQFGSVLGYLAALVAGLASGCIMVMFKKLPYSADQVSAMVWVAGLAANIPMMFLVGGGAVAVLSLGIEWIWVALFALASLLATWTVVRGVQLIDAGTAGILGLLEIVFGILIGVIFFNEHLSAPTLAGMALIIVAAAVPYFQHYRNNKLRLG